MKARVTIATCGMPCMCNATLPLQSHTCNGSFFFFDRTRYPIIACEILYESLFNFKVDKTCYFHMDI